MGRISKSVAVLAATTLLLLRTCPSSTPVFLKPKHINTSLPKMRCDEEAQQARGQSQEGEQAEGKGKEGGFRREACQKSQARECCPSLSKSQFFPESSPEKAAFPLSQNQAPAWAKHGLRAARAGLHNVRQLRQAVHCCKAPWPKP